MSGTPPRVSEEAGREKMYCAVAPKSIHGSRQSKERGAGAPEYIQQGLPGSTPSPRWGRLGWRLGGEGTDVRLQVSSSKSPGHSDSSQAAGENAQEQGESEGGGEPAAAAPLRRPQAPTETCLALRRPCGYAPPPPHPPPPLLGGVSVRVLASCGFLSCAPILELRSPEA